MRYSMGELKMLKHALWTLEQVQEDVNLDAKEREDHLLEAIQDLGYVIKLGTIEQA
jgi:hypothetical protein